jgi:hypothetical protein
MDVSGAIKAYLIDNCNFNDSWYNIFLAFILYVPSILTFAFFGISYYTRQVFWLFTSLALAIDWAFNLLISNWTLEPAPVPTCGGPRAFPSFMTEHSAFMYTYLLMSNHYFNLNLTEWDIFLLQVWVLLTWIASVQLGYNNYKQALIGGVIGHFMAFFFVFICNFFIRAFRNYMLHKGVLHFFGYRDTIYVSSDLTIVITETDLDKLKQIIMEGNYKDTKSLWDALMISFHNSSKNNTFVENTQKKN